MIDRKTQVKLRVALKKLGFEPKSDFVSKVENNIDRFWISRDMVTAIRFKTLELQKWFFYNFKADEEEMERLTTLKYEDQPKGSSKITVETLGNIIKIFMALDECADFTVVKDFPIKIESEHLEVITAPRVD